jgi:hypothetical protein
LASPTVTPDRTLALKPQCVHPVSASSEYTAPAIVAVNTRPPTIVGCARTIVNPLDQRWLRTIFLMSRPPLLCKEGNIAYPNQFVHALLHGADSRPLSYL